MLSTIVILTACGDSKEQAVVPVVAPTVSATKPTDTIPTSSPMPKAVTAFPVHQELLPTDWGDFGWRYSGHIMVELVLDEGCLRARGGEGRSLNNDPVPSFLLIWPDGFTWLEDSGHISISNLTGLPVALVGDTVRLSGRLVDPGSDLANEIASGTPESCAGPYYIVGDEVSVIGQNEPDTLSVPGSTLYFQRLKTRMLTPDMVDSLASFSDPMELELKGDCLLISSDTEPSDRRMVVWPAGFYPHVGDEGTVEVRNGGGRTVAHVGDRLYLRGRKSPAEETHIQRCGVSTLWIVDSLRNADFPPVFSQHQQARDVSGRVRPDFIEGKVVLQNGCMYIEKEVLLWPSDFLMSEEAGSIEIIDATGRDRVREGGKNVILKGRRVKLDDNQGRQIRRALPTDCLAESLFLVSD